MTGHSIRYVVDNAGYIIDWYIVLPKHTADRPVHGGYPTPPKREETGDVRRYGILIDGVIPPIPERGATWTHPTTGNVYVAVIGDQDGAQFWVSKYMGSTERKPFDCWPPLPEQPIEQPTATIHTLYKYDFRDPVQALREIADGIERGQYGEVGCIAVALMGDTVECFGAGTDQQPSSVAMLFYAAFLRMSKAIEEHGK